MNVNTLYISDIPNRGQSILANKNKGTHVAQMATKGGIRVLLWYPCGVVHILSVAPSHLLPPFASGQRKGVEVHVGAVVSTMIFLVPFVLSASG